MKSRYYVIDGDDGRTTEIRVLKATSYYEAIEIFKKKHPNHSCINVDVLNQFTAVGYGVKSLEEEQHITISA